MVATLGIVSYHWLLWMVVQGEAGLRLPETDVSILNLSPPGQQLDGPQAEPSWEPLASGLRGGSLTLSKRRGRERETRLKFLCFPGRPAEHHMK